MVIQHGNGSFAIFTKKSNRSFYVETDLYKLIGFWKNKNAAENQMRKNRKGKVINFKRPAKVQLGCKLIAACDDMDKGPAASLNILSMVRDCTIRFQRLKKAGVDIGGLSCGL